MLKFTEKYMKEREYANEEQFQADAMLMLSQLFPRLRWKIWHTKNENYIPQNEGESKKDYEKRVMITIGRYKALGMLPGVMDILTLHNGILYKSELKLPGQSLGKSQEELHPIWNRDCPQIPVQVFYKLWDVYLYHKWIETNGNYIVLGTPYNRL